MANKDLDQTHVSKKLSTLSLLSIPGVTADEKAVEFGKLADKAFDDQGQTFKIQHLNTEKLPKLIASNEMKVRIPLSTQPSPDGDSKKPAREFNQESIFKGMNQQSLNEEGNLNIRANMKPGHGIVWKEENFRESGPEYLDKFKTKQKLSLDQYNSLFGKNTNSIKERAMSKMDELGLGPAKSSMAFNST